ncbi:hypothetical protein PPSIR1_00065 [Plesiocystis pacifica SIR-1]|uniref:Uncharacterized protein n=1 Tax=Plesiocystis pacifica SIR-1 TaxID=391625 RepID=A6GES8_9BACT|nr:hypothetical protein PPSIR1_00065 [Plesiocystis pacifica SIR-1]
MLIEPALELGEGLRAVVLAGELTAGELDLLHGMQAVAARVRGCVP